MLSFFHFYVIRHLLQIHVYNKFYWYNISWKIFLIIILRCIFSKTWVCQLFKQRKKPNSTRNAGYKAKISVFFFFLIITVLPLSCIVKIRRKHSQNLNLADGLGKLCIQDDVKCKFFSKEILFLLGIHAYDYTN